MAKKVFVKFECIFLGIPSAMPKWAMGYSSPGLAADFRAVLRHRSAPFDPRQKTVDMTYRAL